MIPKKQQLGFTEGQTNFFKYLKHTHTHPPDYMKPGFNSNVNFKTKKVKYIWYF